jgi:hypothetical protein
MSQTSISNLIHDYADAVVCRDGERWAATWDTDGVWDLGGGFEVKGREAIYDLWKGAMGGFEKVIQTVLNGHVDIDEASGSGRGRQYIQEHFEKAKGEFGMMLAYYDDEYVRRGDQWLFASRKLVPLYQGLPDLSGDFHDGSSA